MEGATATFGQRNQLRGLVVFADPDRDRADPAVGERVGMGSVTPARKRGPVSSSRTPY